MGTKASLSSQQETKVHIHGTSNPSAKFNRAWCLEAEYVPCLAPLSRCKENPLEKSENVLATPPLWRSALRDWRVLACGVLQGHRGSRRLCFLYPTANFFLRADGTPALTTQHHTRNLTTERQRRATRTRIWTALRASLEALVSTTSRDMRTSDQSHPSTLMPLALDRQSSWIAGKPTGQRACPLKYQRRHLHGSSAVLSRAPDGTSTFNVLPWSSLCMEYLDHSVVV